VVGYCKHCNGTGALTMWGIYLVDMKGVCSFPRNVSSPCSQLNRCLVL
jgi:hypothetical protein